MSKNKRRSLQQPPVPHNLESKKELIARQSSVTFAGPIPHPAILKQFDDVVPGAAERIIIMAEKQSSHRRNLESQVIESGVRNERRGQIFALIIGLAGVVATVIIALWGNPWVSGAVGFGSLGSLAGVFIFGSRSKRKEREQKQHEQEQE